MNLIFFVTLTCLHVISCRAKNEGHTIIVRNEPGLHYEPFPVPIPVPVPVFKKPIYLPKHLGLANQNTGGLIKRDGNEYPYNPMMDYFRGYPSMYPFFPGFSGLTGLSGFSGFSPLSSYTPISFVPVPDEEKLPSRNSYSSSRTRDGEESRQTQSSVPYVMASNQFLNHYNMMARAPPVFPPIMTHPVFIPKNKPPPPPSQPLPPQPHYPYPYPYGYPYSWAQPRSSDDYVD